MEEGKKEHKIIMYTTTTCGYCVKAKEFLKEHGFSFEEINVGQNREKAQEMIEKSGQMGVPVIDVDGTIIIGFNREKLQRVLGIAE